MYRQLPVGNSSWPSLWEGAGVTPAKGTSRWIGIRVPLVDMDSLLEMRPETRPRHLVSRWSECARAADSGSPRNPWVSWGGEHRSTRISNAYARSADPGSPRNPRFRGVGDGPGKGAPTRGGMQRAGWAPEVRSGFFDRTSRYELLAAFPRKANGLPVGPRLQVGRLQA